MLQTIEKKSLGIQSSLNNLLARNINKLYVKVQEWMAFTTKQVQQDLVRKFAKAVVPDPVDWIYIQEHGKEILKPVTLEVLESGGNKAYGLFKVKEGFDALSLNAVKAADEMCAKLVVEVTKETKKGIRFAVKEGLKEGKSMDKIAREIRPLVGLTERQTQSIYNYKTWLREKRPELSAKDIDKRANTYAGRTHRRRAMTIARTEAANAQNVGYVQGLENTGIEQVEFLSAAGACSICEGMRGNKYDLDKAKDIIPVHPNCRCCMLPVIDGVSACAGKMKKAVCIPPDELHNKQINDLLERAKDCTDPKELGKLEESLKKLGAEIPSELRPLPIVSKINPPVLDHSLRTDKYPHAMTREKSMELARKLKETYPGEVSSRYLETEAAIMTHGPGVQKVLVYEKGKIVGAVATHIDEMEKFLIIDHIGTIAAPKGTGAELMRHAIGRAYKKKIPMSLESSKVAEGFYERLGFIRDKKISKIFHADVKRVKQIRIALGSPGRYTVPKVIPIKPKPVIPKPKPVIPKYKPAANEAEWWKNLSKAEQEGIRAYTGVNYRKMRYFQEVLLNDPKLDLTKLGKGDKILLRHLRGIQSASYTAPKVKGPIYRGLSLDTKLVDSNEFKLFADKVIKGKKTFSFDTIQSFSTSVAQAEKWTGSGWGTNDVFLTFKKAPKGAMNVASKSIHRKEQEVLLVPGRKYKAVKVKKIKKLDVEDAYRYEIELKEII